MIYSLGPGGSSAPALRLHSRHHHGVGVCSLEPVSPNSVTIDVPEPRAAYRPATLAVSVFDHVLTPTIIARSAHNRLTNRLPTQIDFLQAAIAQIDEALNNRSDKHTPFHGEVVARRGTRPLLAHSGRRCPWSACPLSGVKRTSLIRSLMSANDP